MMDAARKPTFFCRSVEMSMPVLYFLEHH